MAGLGGQTEGGRRRTSCSLWAAGGEGGRAGPAGSLCSRLGALESPSLVPVTFWKNCFLGALCGQSGRGASREARGQ